MIVVVLMGIVAVSVIPAMDNVRAMREGAARDDVARLLEVTKARAIAMGSPNGLRVSTSDSTLSVVQIDEAGGVVSMTDPLTNRARVLDIGVTYQSVKIEAMVNGDGVSGPGVIWFDYEAVPHTRSSSGTFEAFNNEPVSIELSSGQIVLVHPHTGVVELP
jgi:Tfp pilus assembly protein FimT